MRLGGGIRIHISIAWLKILASDYMTVQEPSGPNINQPKDVTITVFSNTAISPYFLGIISISFSIFALYHNMANKVCTFLKNHNT